MNQETPDQKIERLESVLRATLPVLDLLSTYFIVRPHFPDSPELGHELQKLRDTFDGHLKK